MVQDTKASASVRPEDFEGLTVLAELADHRRCESACNEVPLEGMFGIQGRPRFDDVFNCFDKIGEIRQAHFREGRSINGISRDLGVPRGTIRKVLRTGATGVGLTCHAPTRCS